MKSRLTWLLILLLCGSLGHACIWIDATTLEGKFITIGDLPDPPEGAAPFDQVTHITGEGRPGGLRSGFLRAIAATLPDKVFETFTGQQQYFDVPDDWPPGLNDAVRPIFTGDYKKAAEMLAEFNVKYPNNYYVCANLGVTSELAGNDVEALQWVEKAMRIKPDAHYGTEWMHAAVLRAKLAMAKDPAWLEKHTISGIPFGQVPEGFFLSEGERRIGLEEIQKALYAHVVPRLLLVKGQDRIVAAMLTELARVEARAVSVEAGIEMLKLATGHGAANTGPLLREWEKRVTHRKMWSWWRSNERGVYFSILCLVGIAAYFVWRFRRWRRVQSGEAVTEPKPDSRFDY